MLYYTPDVSGENPAYRQSNDRYLLSALNQRIEFDGPVFRDGLSITLLTTPPLLLSPADWTVVPEDRDTTAEAKVKTIDSTFSKELIKAVTITRAGLSYPVTASFTYQKLYPVARALTLNAGDVVEFTPDLLLDIQARLAHLTQLVAPVADVHASIELQPRLLEEDATGLKPENWIADERHTVNTFAKKNIIRPIQGAFFSDTAVLRIPESNLTLEAGRDYIPIELDRVRTAKSPNKSPVHRAFELTYAFAGTVHVDYQAYGGTVTLNDAVVLYQLIRNATNFLDQQVFLTPDSLPAIPVIQEMLGRLNSTEMQVRNLLNSGLPSYGDVTTGQPAAVRKFKASDTALHWYTIATLFKVAGSDDLITADRFRFRMRAVNADLMADVEIAWNEALKKLTLETSSVLQDVGFTLYGAVTGVPVAMPQFRILWMEGTSAGAGAVLQIGLSLPTTSETVAFEDLSGMEGCWLLVPSNTTDINPQDNGVTMPDGLVVWDTASADAKAITKMMPNATGYLAWAGSQDTKALDSVSGALALTHVLPAATFQVHDAHTLDVHLTDNGTPVVVRVPLTGTTAAVRRGSAVAELRGALTAVEVVLTRVNATTVTLTAQVKADYQALGAGVAPILRYVVARV